jgi:hypothetical protein
MMYRCRINGQYVCSSPVSHAADDAFILGRESVGSASGPASPILTEYGRRVGSLGPGLTSDSADAARAVLRDDLSAGPQVYGTRQRCRPDLPGLGRGRGSQGPAASGRVPSLQPEKRDGIDHRRDTHHRRRGHSRRRARRCGAGSGRRATRRRRVPRHPGRPRSLLPDRTGSVADGGRQCTSPTQNQKICARQPMGPAQLSGARIRRSGWISQRTASESAHSLLSRAMASMSTVAGQILMAVHSQGMLTAGIGRLRRLRRRCS